MIGLSLLGHSSLYRVSTGIIQEWLHKSMDFTVKKQITVLFALTLGTNDMPCMVSPRRHLQIFTVQRPGGFNSNDTRPRFPSTFL